MKKLAVVFALLSISLLASDLPVPETLIGKGTVGILNVDLSSLKSDQLLKTVAAVTGQPADPKGKEQLDAFQAQLKAAGVQSLNVIFNQGKKGHPETASDAVVLVVDAGEKPDAKKVAELIYTLAPPLKQSMDPDCPKDVDGKLVWHNKAFKLPEADDDTSQSFTNAFFEIADDQSISLVLVPDEAALATAEEALKTAKPEDKDVLTALMKNDGVCIFSDFGVADEPALKILVLAPDAQSAVSLNKAADAGIAALKKDAPPELKGVLDNLKAVHAGTNVELSLGVADISKAVKALMAMFMPAPTK